MLSNEDFEAIINDDSKQIDGDIIWQNNPQHYYWLDFKAEVNSGNGITLFIHGSYNQTVTALSYHLIHPPYGRIYGLDLGKDHKNPDGRRIGEKHKHSWSEAYCDKQAYVPDDITAPATDPIAVWQQFCQEATITHSGYMRNPPARQLDLFL